MGADGRIWLRHFTADEIRELRVIREHRAWLTLLVNYGLIAASMAVAAYAPNALTVIVALFIIGTRQLGFAVVMHESAHHTLFGNRKLNDFVGNWLAAYPIYLSADMYRTHHLEHHAKTWTDGDPDLSLAKGFPVSKASMLRKVARDLFGITGFKQLIGTTYLVLKVVRGEQVDAGTLPLRLERGPAIRMVVGTIVTNLILFGILWALGHPLLYLLWLGAWLTTNKLVARIRSIAEHAVVPDPTDPIGQTRTVRAGWLARLLIAPNRVQYHLEHHLLMTVPHYNLPKFHEMLRERGLLEDACIADNYAQVLRAAVV
ncbi:MAG: fatty acid desaturase family protein [Myxococcales bacterium]|nr:MAG: fatty acid desaturase family protein [Myxococcales bacterium]